MKNAPLFLIAGMAVVVFGGGYVLTRSEPPVTTASRRAPTDSARPTAPGGSSPQLAGRSFGHAPQVTTDVRASIFDAPDIYAAVKRARDSGTADEKGWAAEALRACYVVVQDESREQPQIKALRARARAEETAAVTAKREAAFAIVDGQCSGVRAVSMPQRQALLKELREGALPHGPMTPTQTLNSLLARQRAGDSYWSDTDAGLVSSALHGEDPRIRRLAFAVVVSAIDRGTPEGALRSDALMNAMSLDINGPSLSTFEARLPCALLGQCDDLPFVGGTGPMSPESERLMAAYRQAFDKREPYSRILAIR